jgi:hypothetical protein
MTRYFELSIEGNTMPWAVANWLKEEIVSLPPSPITVGDRQVELTNIELEVPDGVQGGEKSSTCYLQAYACAWQVGPEFAVGDAKMRLLKPERGQDCGVVISVELREIGVGTVHLLGECDDFWANFAGLKIRRIKELWPRTRELTPQGVKREQALTWVEAMEEKNRKSHRIGFRQDLPKSATYLGAQAVAKQ